MGESAAKLLQQKRRNRAWWKTVLDKVNEEEVGLIDDMFNRRSIRMEKLLDSLNAAIDKYFTFDDHERDTADPDVLKAGQAVEKHREQLSAVLDYLVKKVAWPKGGGGAQVLKEELARLQRMDPVHTQVNEKGRTGTISRDLKGRDLDPELRTIQTANGMDRQELRKAKDSWQAAQVRARQLKLQYAEARRDAKEAFEAFEKLAIALSPTYVARKIDWSDAGSWDQVDPAMQMAAAEAAAKKNSRS